MIRAKGRGFKSTDKISQECQADYERLGKLMGDKVWSRRALNQLLVEKAWGRPRSRDPGSRKAYAYIKFHEFLDKDFIIEFRPYERLGITELHYRFRGAMPAPELPKPEEPRNEFWEAYIAKIKERRQTT